MKQVDREIEQNKMQWSKEKLRQEGNKKGAHKSRINKDWRLFVLYKKVENLELSNQKLALENEGMRAQLSNYQQKSLTENSKGSSPSYYSTEEYASRMVEPEELLASDKVDSQWQPEEDLLPATSQPGMSGISSRGSLFLSFLAIVCVVGAAVCCVEETGAPPQ